HAFFSGRCLWQMIVGGVFDRFPDLRVVFVETEVHWIGSALKLFDSRMHLGDDWTDFAAHLERARAFSRMPSEYWATNCYAGISPFDAAQLPIEQLGSNYERAPGEFIIGGSRSMFGVDYPHFESIFPDTSDRLGSLIDAPTVNADDVERVVF